MATYRDPITNTLYPSKEYYNATQQIKGAGLTITTENVNKALAGNLIPAVSPTVSPTVAPTVAPTTQVNQMTAEQLRTAISSTQGQISTLTTQLEEARKSEDVNAGTGAAFTPPATTASNIMDTYVTSALDSLKKSRIAVENAYQTQLDNIKKQSDEAQKKYDDLVAKQEDILTEAKPLTEPFRADIETAERARLGVEENYQANQALTNELDTLLTQIQNDLLAEKNVTGLASIREPRIAQATEEATARVGVIEAVMAARNNQIIVANNLIDRTVNAMTADRQDQLNYYNSLLSFYDKQMDVQGNKLIQLTADEKDTINKQISLLETDLNLALSNAENIKKAMTDPDTAQAYAQAGVTLNDSPEVINQKLAAYAYTKELQDTSNAKAEQGYTYLSPGQSAPSGSQVVTTTDSKGNTKQWYIQPTPQTMTPDTTVADNAKSIMSNINSAVDQYKLNPEGFRENYIKALTSTYGEEYRDYITEQVYALLPDIKPKTETTTTPADISNQMKNSAQQYKDAGWTRKDFENQWKADNKITTIPSWLKIILKEIW